MVEGHTGDSNRPDDPQYIVRLIGQGITVSLGIVKTVKALPRCQLPAPNSHSSWLAPAARHHEVRLQSLDEDCVTP
jgi:hypothetical protein